MIAKAKSISHTRASMYYGWNQEKGASIIYKQNLIGMSPDELSKEFKFIQDLNNNCKRNTISFILSPTIEDGKKLTSNSLSEIVINFIYQMKLENNQAVAFVHKDKAHLHAHLYINRIGFDGNAYNDSFIGKKSQKAAEIVATKLGLTTVKQVIENKLNSEKEDINYVYKTHIETINNLKTKTFDLYCDAMKKNNISIVPTINSSKMIQGLRYKIGNKSFKGSEINKSMSIQNILLDIYQEGIDKLIIEKQPSILITNTPVLLNTILIENLRKNRKNNTKIKKNNPIKFRR